MTHSADGAPEIPPSPAAPGTTSSDAGELARLRTENSRLAARLAAADARLDAILDYAPIGIVIADATGAPLYTNRGFRRILDLDTAEDPGLDWVNRIRAGEREQMIAHQQALVDGRESEFMLEFHYESPRRGTRIVRSRVVRVDAPHADFRFIGLGEDLTEEREHAAAHERLLTQMRHAQRLEALGQLSGGIAHDFNNILAVIVGFGNLARGHPTIASDAKLLEYLTAVTSAGERGRELVSKMLTFSRATPETARHVLPVDMAVREVVEMMRSVIPSSIHLDMQTQTSRAIRIDPIDLHQVLVNLLVNARDAIEAHGTIEITALEQAPGGEVCTSCLAPLTTQSVRLIVHDSGAGIPPDILARIFEPFYTTKEVGRGTGMGLSVVHGIVHQGAGHILVESGPGRGTTFTLVFDSAEPSASASTASPAVPLHTVLAGSRALVVDDEASIRGFLAEMLQFEGMDVQVAENGREALRMIREDPARFDVVVSDQTMPEMTGTELIAALRADGIDIPVVLSSGYRDAASREELQHLPGVRFLGKPATPRAMIAALREALAGASG